MFWKNKKKKITDVRGDILPEGFDKNGKQVKPLSEVDESETDNPFEEAHRKAKDDVDNFELRETLFEARTIMLSLCDLINEWIVLSKKYEDNIELEAKIIEAKTMIREDIRKQEHMLEDYIDMNNTTAIEFVKKTIELVKKEIEEWNN
jgi:hypothetical protein